MFGNRDQLNRIERKIDDHAKATNGHPQRTIKGLTLTQWLIAILISALVGADLVVDVWTRIGLSGG